MKRIVVRYTPNTEVLAVAPTEQAAHSLAENISYVQHTNAVYFLHGISLMDLKELSSTEAGRTAWQTFITGV